MGVFTGLRQGLPSTDHNLGIQIGSVCCALKCEDNEIYHKFRKLYRDFLTEQKAEITIELEVTDQAGPDNTSETRNTREDNRARTAGQRASCKYDPARQAICITGDRSLVDPDTDSNYLNQLFSLAYYSACRMKYNDCPPAMLVHSCGVLRNGRVLLFAGSSGAGKSTVARLCSERDGEVINDEMLLISRQTAAGDGISVQSAPIISRLSPRQNKAGLLRCILLLKQSNRTLARRLDRVDAYIQFMRQIITPVYIGQTEIKDILPLVTEFSDEVTRTVPVYELEFTLNGESLWQSVGELERELIRRESV